MCNFLSAIYTRTGDLLTRPDLTDSHSDLLDIFNLREDGEFIQNCAKLELKPPEPSGADITDVSTWTFRIDEREAPQWMDVERAGRLMRDNAASMIITDKRKTLWEGAWVICGEGSVSGVRGVTRIIRLQDSAQVGNVWDSAQVGDVGDSAQVGNVWGSARVGIIGPKATVAGKIGPR